MMIGQALEPVEPPADAPFNFSHDDFYKLVDTAASRTDLVHAGVAVDLDTVNLGQCRIGFIDMGT